jgi:ankyrin repeat protein
MTGNTKNDQSQDQAVGNIIIAADHGRLDIVTKLLEGGIDPNTVDEIGTSALHNAAKRGHWHIARLLLEKNALPTL